MQIDIILEPDLTPAQVAEIAVAAENYGFRTLWHSNYHQNPDAFVALVPAALATSKIRLGVLAVSPYEMHPLKIGNALLTLNEISKGRAVVAIGGGGSVMGAIGIKMDPKAQRMLRGVREAVEMVKAVDVRQVRAGLPGRGLQAHPAAEERLGKAADSPGVHLLHRPEDARDGGQGRRRHADERRDAREDRAPHGTPAHGPRRARARRPRISASATSGPGTSRRIGEKSMYEARRELVFRGELLPPKYDMEPYVTAEERQLVIDKWQNFAKAFWTRSGKIEDVPESIVNRLIAACSSAGGLGDIDQQIERFRVFEKAGLTELSIRLFDEPMAGLKIVAEHVLPHFERY